MNGVRLYRYRLPLREPVPLRGVTLTSREGLLLRHDAADGTTRWAEAAPLPGFSNETLAEVIDAAGAGEWTRYPSLRFALQSLALPCPAEPLAVNALLLGSAAEISRRIDDIAELPHRVLKWKVGRPGQLEPEIQCTRAICAALRNDQSLRLDANRCWDWNEAVRFAEAVADCKINYIEEPLQRSEDCERWRAETGGRYALDETLRERVVWDDFHHVSALIIKPTLMGDLQDFAESVPLDVPWVFSSCFESGIGIRAIASLMLHYNAMDSPAGLDTYRWLANDLAVPPLALTADTLVLPSEPLRVDNRYLDELFT